MSHDPNEFTRMPLSRDLWHSDSLTKEMRDKIKRLLMPEYTGYFAPKYKNLTPQQIEAEFSTLFDDIVERDGTITPDISKNLRYLLKERLDANSGVLGDMLNRGKGDLLPSSHREDLLPAGRKEYLSPSSPSPYRLDPNNGNSSDFQKNDMLNSDKENRLNFLPQSSPYAYAQPSKRQDLVRALLKAKQRRMTYGGPR